MLTIYRRHYAPCKHAGSPHPRRFRNCQCPIWVQGTLGSQTVKRALELRSWQAASDLVRDWEVDGRIDAPKPVVPTIREAVERFLADAAAQNLKSESIRKYRNVLEKRLIRWTEGQGLIQLQQLGVEQVREFRRTWADGAGYATKNLERLRTFFRFCEAADWIRRNPAKSVKPPKTQCKPTLPFSEDEMTRILCACGRYVGNQSRMRAFVLAMRYSGLRIGDTIALTTSRVQGNKLFLYTAKTGTPVYVPLPPITVQALAEIAPSSGGRYFSTGNAQPKTARANWSRYLDSVFRNAAVENAHSHRFRDTFAVRLLEKGVPMETVSILLGHSSIRVTERHYRPWVRSLQDKLETEVAKTW